MEPGCGSNERFGVGEGLWYGYTGIQHTHATIHALLRYTPNVVDLTLRITPHQCLLSLNHIRSLALLPRPCFTATPPPPLALSTTENYELDSTTGNVTYQTRFKALLVADFMNLRTFPFDVRRYIRPLPAPRVPKTTGPAARAFAQSLTRSHRFIHALPCSSHALPALTPHPSPCPSPPFSRLRFITGADAQRWFRVVGTHR